MSNLVKHAEREMRLAGLYDKDADYDGMIPEAVMKLIKVHSKERHSGSSHALTLSIFAKVANFKTLTPLTNDPSEWMEVSEEHAGRPGVWQSNRQSSCFSEDGGKTYHDIDAPDPKAKVTSLEFI